MSNWIPVEEKDKLPKPGEDVWVFYPSAYCGSVGHIMDDDEKNLMAKITGNKYDGLWWDGIGWFHPMNDVTRHMPLPDPPTKNK